ncbi:hypothetical protein HFU84_10765 [Acidithiobacillus sp. CV18-2]|nr:hypothetical protein [Acidithiobacillus sp. CV18-3]MBU2758461.1 hypothetical protein [Acidithiobacillus sp. BN09-2]MBU2777977.1 hypothetical protein [Acidithiobacillus sp. CV18-2]MBU2798069.1 hypothetical protein [Acidithiobacillus sp. VAN18-4]
MKTQDTMLLWDWSKAEGVHNLLAVKHPPAQRHPQRYSAGACDSWWHTHPKGPSLAVIFGGLLAQGITDPRPILEQLARIEDAPGWVADMLEGMDAWNGC